jgi:hypothetical protein
LVNIIRRAQYIGGDLPCSDALKTFLENSYTIENFKDPSVLDAYAQLDDNDVWGAVKLWKDYDDHILSQLCMMLLKRELFQIQIGGSVKQKLEKVRRAVAAKYKTLRNDTSYFFSIGTLTNEAYVTEGQPIKVLMRNGNVLDIAQASELPNIKAISKIVKKDYLCWPKNVSLS